MDVISILIVLASLFLGWSIGANDGANSIGTLLSSELMSFRKAVLVLSVFALLGALLQGYRVSNTVGRKIISSDTLESNREAVLASLLSAGILVFVVNGFGFPLSVTQAVVGGIVGVGVALGLTGQINHSLLSRIFLCWVIAPFLSAMVAFLSYKLLITPLSERISVLTFNRIFKVFTLLGSAFIAYNIGANDIGNAVGPIVGAKVLTDVHLMGLVISDRVVAAFFIGLTLGLGALIFGKGVVVTLSEKITTLGPITAFTAQLAAALTVYSFVLVGIPVSTTQAFVGGIVGVGLTKGVQTVNTKTLKYILVGWVATPLCVVVGSVILYKSLMFLKALSLI